jgi:hypothetical protein
MKIEYLYAIVDVNGACWRITGRETEKAFLPELLAEGWRPIRETPFHQATGISYILICLEREPNGPSVSALVNKSSAHQSLPTTPAIRSPSR